MKFVAARSFTDPDADVEIANVAAGTRLYRSSFVPFPVVLRPTAGLAELGSL